MIYSLMKKQRGTSRCTRRSPTGRRAGCGTTFVVRVRLRLRLLSSSPLPLLFRRDPLPYVPAIIWPSLRVCVGVSGYFLPLSGGADSSAVAAIVGSMCQLVLLEISKGNEQVYYYYYLL